MTKGALPTSVNVKWRPHIDDALDALRDEQQIALDGRTYTLIVKDEEPMPAPD